MLVERRGPGRKFEYKPGVVLDVPDNVLTVQCSKCDAYHLGEESDKLEHALILVYNETLAKV